MTTPALPYPWYPKAGLAPMEGVTDIPLRLWYWLIAQPEAMATPFLRATRTYPHKGLPGDFAPELTRLAACTPYRLTPQVMAAEADDFLRASDYVLRVSELVELNAGCPSPTCTGKGAGSSLLREVDGFREMLVTLTQRVGPRKLAVKMRTGYQDARELPLLIEALADLPLARLTVHGRTRPDKYLGHSRWDLVEHAARRVPFPVVASGDVVDLASHLALRLAAPSAPGLMIGRGALRHPFLFEELRAGAPVSVPTRLVPLAVAAHTLLSELYGRGMASLLELVEEDGLLTSPPGRDEAAWERVVRLLAAKVSGKEPSSARAWDELVVSRVSLGRAKMTWNYWRSSLPAVYFAPLTMRAKTLGELLTAIDALGQEHGAASVTPRHRPDLDWLYSGAGRQPQGERCTVAEVVS